VGRTVHARADFADLPHLHDLHGPPRARRQTQETSDLHLATIEALAGAIDAKDQMTNAHILRVQFFAVGLAEAVGLSAEDIQGVKTAALLHDIGKLAVPEHILSKPGRSRRRNSRRSGFIRASAPKSSPACLFRIRSPR
jgi:response regulator RpfG family c-di-GMP phosphodiesterase